MRRAELPQQPTCDGDGGVDRRSVRIDDEARRDAGVEPATANERRTARGSVLGVSERLVHFVCDRKTLRRNRSSEDCANAIPRRCAGSTRLWIFAGRWTIPVDAPRASCVRATCGDGAHCRTIPNAENVLSNLPFALIGAWTWRAHARCEKPGPLVWRGFALALICTAFGSAIYHWAPRNGALVFDRLPIAWACALLTCALLPERVDARWCSTSSLSVVVLTATAAVALWWLGEPHGVGDLRPYLFVQFLPMLLAPIALLLKLPAQSRHALRNSDWWMVLGLYAAAKLMQLADHTVLDALGFTSGHTLKHLLAAGAALWLLRAATRQSLPFINSDSPR